MTQLTLSLNLKTVEQAVKELKKLVALKQATNSVSNYNFLKEDCNKLAVEAIKLGTDKKVIEELLKEN